MIVNPCALRKREYACILLYQVQARTLTCVHAHEEARRRLFSTNKFVSCLPSNRVGKLLQITILFNLKIQMLWQKKKFMA